MLVHPVNTQGFNARGSDIVPEDGKNINRVFPGDRDGTITDQIAYVLTHEFQDEADFYIDIHGGDLNELMTPLAFFPGAAEREVTEVSLGAAKSLRVEYLVRSGAKTGAYNSAAIRGVPSILIERGGRGLWGREEVEEYKKDVRNVLKHLGVLNGEPELNGKTPVEVTGVVYLRATNAGCWYPCVTANEKVAVGQKLGEVRDFFGKVL
ncbi:MAG TPA: succinylglutamate desuccinylase/aspartoacylase family protein, partial [Clostridia bacterium]|nr:succinylglutamate desuccinylase/aspartoacylase family protein [Clostridia bacterium]